MRGEPVRVRRLPVPAHERAVATDEELGHLDHAVLDPARQRHDLAHAPTAVGVARDVDDDVHAPGHRRGDERRRHVLPREQRKSAELGHGLAGGVGVQGGHARLPAVQRDEQVESLLLAHLADDETVRAHAQRLLDQPTQPHLAGALERGLARLHGHPVGVRQPQLEDLLRSDDAFARRHRVQQAGEQGRFARACAARDDHVQPGDHGRLEEARRLGGEGAQPHEVVEAARRSDELADVDAPVPPHDVGDHHVEPAAVGQRRVDERRAQVDAPPGGAQHPLDEVLHARIGQDRRGQLRAAAARDEDAAGVVDPDLLDLVVVEVALQRPEAGDRVEQLAHQRVGLLRAARQQGRVVRLRHDRPHARGHLAQVTRRVQALAAQRLAHLVLEPGQGSPAVVDLTHRAPPCRSPAAVPPRRGER